MQPLPPESWSLDVNPTVGNDNRLLPSSLAAVCDSPPAVPDYELLLRIGRGAYGEVWLARNILGELRAAKIIFRNRFLDGRPFEREFEGIRRFEPISRSHPSQLAILHVGKIDALQCCYYVMELADDANRREASQTTAVEPSLNGGLVVPANYRPRTLRAELTKRDRLLAAECIQIAISLTQALAHLHRHGLVHRDIKPSNILFVGGVPKLGDIGLVTEAGDSQSIVGTEGYVAPEGPGTIQADLFSLGKVLYEMSTAQDRRSFPDLPLGLKNWTDRKAVLDLNEIIIKACANDCRLRYKSCEELLVDLKRLQTGRSVAVHRRLLLRESLFKWGPLFTVSGMALASAIALHLFRRDAEISSYSSTPQVESLVRQADHIVGSVAPDRLDTALRLYQQAVELDRAYVPAYIGICNVRTVQSGGPYSPTPEALANFRAATAQLRAVAPGLCETWYKLAILAYIDRQFAVGLEQARRAVRLPATSKEGRAKAHCVYGWFLMNAGKPSEALKEYQVAAVLFPADPDIERHLGDPYRVWRRFQEALEHNQRSIDLEPGQLAAYHERGLIYQDMGEYLSAIEFFKQAHLKAGDSTNTLQFWDELREEYKIRGRSGYWNRLLRRELESPDPKPHDVALCLAHLGRMAEAYDWLEKASREGQLGNLWADSIWDHKDERFRRIARTVGLEP